MGRRGAQIAGQITAALGGDLFVPGRWQDMAGAGAQTIRERGFAEAVRAAFVRYQGLVLVVPVGIAIRALAPVIQDKRTDPAVVAVDEAGRHAIALLSGHLGGANKLARQVAAAIGAQPVITTAAEVLDTLALDLLGQEWGWTIERSDSLTRASAAVISGEPVGCYQDAGDEDWWPNAPAHLTRYDSVEALLAAPVAARIVITDQSLPRVDPEPTCVIVRPRTLVLGVGSVRGITADELDELIDATLARATLARASVRELATIDAKAEEEGINELAARNGWPVRYFSAAQLAGIESQSGGSPLVEKAVGTAAVCEPAALLAAGATDLVVPKTRTRRATVAIARVATYPIHGSHGDRGRPPLPNPPPPGGRGSVVRGDPGGTPLPNAPLRLARESGPRSPQSGAHPPEGGLVSPLRAGGRGSVISRGRLAIVGLGPGGPDDLTQRGRRALESAEVIVGYEAYLDLVRPWLGPKSYHGSRIGDELERCGLALDLLQHGRSVALVSSGDAGIYGMAGLVFELMDRRGAGELVARTEIIPGVSAAQAAAALLGAPLMSDFAAISLSDLLTPWSVIEGRIEAAAASDLVVVFYNPASTRRRTQLARARDILLRHRAPTTPVGLVRNASRPDQAISITELEHLLEHPVDMLTTVIVGNSATVRIGDRMVTRRGYAVAPPSPQPSPARGEGALLPPGRLPLDPTFPGQGGARLGLEPSGEPQAADPSRPSALPT